MSAPAASGPAPERHPLTRDRVLRAALDVADADGIAGLTIRSLATRLGVKPMSVYYHVANKEEILDGIVDLVFAEIDLPDPDGDWRSQVRRRAASARAALVRHPWAVALLESRTTPGPENLRQHDAMLGTLRAGGFSVRTAGHAYAVLDAYVYGVAVTETSLPFLEAEGAGEVAEAMMADFASGQYPHLVELATEVVLQPGYDFRDEFEFGLDLLLNALDDLRSE
jgi:AcrR family transcriptional regulator